MNRRRWTEKCKIESKANTDRVHKNDVLEEDTRTFIVDISERIIITSRQAMTLVKLLRKK